MSAEVPGLRCWLVNSELEPRESRTRDYRCLAGGARASIVLAGRGWPLGRLRIDQSYLGTKTGDPGLMVL